MLRALENDSWCIALDKSIKFPDGVTKLLVFSHARVTSRGLEFYVIEEDGVPVEKKLKVTHPHLVEKLSPYIHFEGYENRIFKITRHGEGENAEFTVSTAPYERAWKKG